MRNAASGRGLNIHRLAKRFAFQTLGSSPRVLHRIDQVLAADLVTILNFHRVAENDGSGYPPLEPLLFSKILDFIQENYTVITFSDLKDCARKKRNEKPLVILSFDDGYKDFVTNTVPELKLRGLKCNQNIIPACIENQFPPLNVAVQDYIGKTSFKEYSKLRIGRFEWNSSNTPEKESLRASAYLKNLRHDQQLHILDQLLDEHGDEIRLLATPMMDTNDLKSILDICEIGCHSFSHSNMGEESNEYFRTDIRECKSWFWNTVGFEPNIYAFPNGSYRQEQLAIAHDEGFETVLLVGDNFSQAQNSVHFRFGMSPRSISEARFQIAGKFTKVNQ